jgi:KDO2-lipid IV(A) lauroyltransferase
VSLLLRVLAGLVGLLPWGALRALGAALGWLVGDALRVRRAHVAASMRAAGIAAAPGAMYRSLGASAFEFLWMSRRGGEALDHVRVEGASQDLWRDTLGRGRGVVIAATHTGNWDLAACAIARETELLVVTKRLSVRALDAFWQSTRAGLGVHLADARGAMARARGVLRRGGAVAMMIDQAPASTPARHAVETEFLGRPALVDRAAAALAAAAGAPLVVAASRRDASGDHVLCVLDVLHPPPRRRGATWVREASRRATAALDVFVRGHPSQWLWLHRRWKRAMLPAPCTTTSSSSPAEASRAA